MASLVLPSPDALLSLARVITFPFIRHGNTRTFKIMLRTTSHVWREPVNTPVISFYEPFTFKSLRLDVTCSRLSKILTSPQECWVHVIIGLLPDHLPAHPCRIVVQRPHACCHVVVPWRHTVLRSYCRHPLLGLLFLGCSLEKHPLLNHLNLWSHVCVSVLPLLPSCASECRYIFASECQLDYDCSTTRRIVKHF